MPCRAVEACAANESDVASGYSANVRTKEIMEQGAAAFIKKPYRYEELNKIIRKVLED